MIIKRQQLLVQGVYAICNTLNDKVYVGQALNIYDRVKVHKSHLERGVHHSVLLQRFVNKHGIDKLFIRVLQVCKRGMTPVEQKWIDKLNSFFNCNKTAGIKPKGWKHSPEAIEKIRLTSTGRFKSAETIEKIRNSNIGLKRSDETRLNMSKAKSGKKLSRRNRLKAIKVLRSIKHYSKLKPRHVVFIKKQLKVDSSFDMFRKLATRFNVHERTIQAIKQNRSWTKIAA